MNAISTNQSAASSLMDFMRSLTPEKVRMVETMDDANEVPRNRGWKRWTPSEERLCRTLHAQGHGVVYIAHQLGRAESSIREKLKAKKAGA